MEPLSNRELFKRVLLDTSLFSEPGGELRGAFDLKASARECYLFASYGAPGSGFYLYDEKVLLQPIGDGDSFRFPWPPLTSVSSFDLEGFYRQLADPLGFRVGPPVGSIPVELAKRDGEVMESIMAGEKLVKLMLIEVPEGSAGTIRGSLRAQFRALEELVGECRKVGVKPSDVLVLTQDPLNDEGFFEYLAGVSLRKRNYLVTKEPLCRPLNADIFGYRGRTFSSGAFLLEICLGMGDIAEGGSNEESAALVEAERTAELGADSKHGIGQAVKYLDEGGGFYERGFVSAPLLTHLLGSDTRVGLITYDGEGRICFKEAPPTGGSSVGSTTEEARRLLHLARMKGKVSTDLADGTLDIKI